MARGFQDAGDGGAIFNNTGGIATVVNCTFINNSVNGASPNTGGAVFNRNGTMLLSGNTFQANTADVCANVFNLGDDGLATLTLKGNSMTNDLDLLDLMAAVN